jgi:hypothetical protein
MLKNWTIAISIALLVISQVTAAPAATPLTTMRVASKLTKPLHMGHAPGDFDRAFIVQQAGKIPIQPFADYAKASADSLAERYSVSGDPQNFECRERRGCLSGPRVLNACDEPRRWLAGFRIERWSSLHRDRIRGIFMRSEVETPLRSKPAIAKTGSMD